MRSSLSSYFDDLDYFAEPNLDEFEPLSINRPKRFKTVRNFNKHKLPSINPYLYTTSFKSTGVDSELVSFDSPFKKSMRATLFTLKMNFSDFTEHFMEVVGEAATHQLKKKKKIEYVDHEGNAVQLFDSTRVLKKMQMVVQPVLSTKFTIFIGKFNKGVDDYIQVGFNKPVLVEKKTVTPASFFVVKQKRYKLKQTVPVRVHLLKVQIGRSLETIEFPDSPLLSNFIFFENSETIPTSAYKLFQKNKVTSETIDAQLARRLLRTRKTLVLPAQVNLTLITNSYDVVHSWFIPMLGLKMDCIPGRSTHHSFYVDNLGFFYGQCAEICGRYHHHMPVRLCLLPYEHFFI